MSRPVLHRDDPKAEPLTGNVKVTRKDWLNVAMDVLVSDGVETVKVLTLADRMGVSRSSFYWYFKSRQDLLDALLDEWQAMNTAGFVGQCEAPADTVTGAVLNVWRCVVNPALFDTALDFAIRDWARRSGKVRHLLDRSDATRLDALTAMFARYGFGTEEAGARARALYYMQIGYDLADLGEPVDLRLSRVSQYLLIFTGQMPQSDEVARFAAYTRDFGPQGETAHDPEP